MTADLHALSKLPRDEAFRQWLGLPGEWVEEPNVRRGGESGVKRLLTTDGKVLYRKQQIAHTYRSLRHPFGYPTSMREASVLRDFTALKVIVPVVVYSDCRKVSGTWHSLLVTQALDGFSSLEDCYARGDHQQWGEALHRRIVHEVGRTQARFNRARWQHGCLRMKHLFVRLQDDNVEIATLDLEKTRQRITALYAARHDISQLRRHTDWSDELWQCYLQGYAETFGPAFKDI